MDLDTIQNLFTGKVFRIPAYQRAYSWELQQWQDLIEDLAYLPEGRDHFTGMIVIEPTDESMTDREGTRHRIVDIVDGQQRLTTIVIFLEALRRHAPPDLAAGIGKRYIATMDAAGQEHMKLMLAEPARDYFERSVLTDPPAPGGPRTAAEQRLTEAMEFFTAHLTNLRDEAPDDFEAAIFDLHDKLTSRLRVMLYDVASDAEVGVMFEVMNNRGRRLSELDLVKNYILFLGTKLSLPDNEGRFLEGDVAAIWAKLLTALMDAGLSSSADEDRLLRATWLMAYDPSRKDWQRSRSIKKRFNLRAYEGRDADLLSDLRDYVHLLGDCSGLFADIYAPSRPQAFAGLATEPNQLRRLGRATERLGRLNVLGVFLPLLMAVRLRRPMDAELYLETLELCERFAFRVYRLRGARADTGEASLVAAAHRLYNGELDHGDVLEEVARILGWYSSHEQFKQAFAVEETENQWYAWGGIAYFLYEYEQTLCGTDPPELSWETLRRLDRARSIEHVYPQTPDDSYWTERFDEDAARKWKHDLGNLALSKDNGSYSNHAYPRKRGALADRRPCYANSPMKNEREIAQAWTDWTPESIAERRDRLVEFALRRWYVDIPGDDEGVLRAPVEEEQVPAAETVDVSPP